MPYQTAHSGNCSPFTARFPAFWVTYPFDAFPDMDHGGCAMIGLQEMLLQTPDDRILILPAWQQDWDVHFKLRAPKNTTIECELRHGKITKLEVTPRSRRKDVVICARPPCRHCRLPAKTPAGTTQQPRTCPAPENFNYSRTDGRIEVALSALEGGLRVA